MRRANRSRFMRYVALAALLLGLLSAGLLASSSTTYADGWNSTDQLPAPLFNQVAVTDGTYLYILGGANSGAKSAVYSSVAGSKGTLGKWQTLTPLPQPLYNHAGVLQNGYVIILGGQNNAGVQATAYSAPLHTGGTLGSWITTTVLPQPLYDHAAVTVGNQVYVIAGFGSDNLPRSTVYSATQTGATLGSWASQPALPQAVGELGAATANGYIYAVGGSSGHTGAFANVYAAKVGTGGALGAWQSLTPLPQARKDLSVVVANGYLWAIGGYNSSSVATGTVYRAPINADGTIGSWLAMTPLPGTVGEQTTTVIQNYLLIAGNKVGTNSGSSVIYDAPVAGPWVMLSPYSVKAGSKVTVSGTGYTAGETVAISFNGTPMTSISADSTGSFGLNGTVGASFVVPATTTSGRYPVVGVGQTSALQGQASLKVQVTATPTPTATATTTATPTPTATATATPTATPTPPPGGSDDWPAYLYDVNHTGYNSAFTAIGTSNAASLAKKWSYTTGGSIESNPAVATIDGIATGTCSGTSIPIAFVGSWDGYLYAINATTGAVCWKTFLATDTLSPSSTQCINSLGITSSPTVAIVSLGGTATQVVYAGASDIMFAVNAATGQVIWHNPLAGQDVGTFSPSYIWSSPAYSAANSTIYTSTASFCDAQAATLGTIYALDPASGVVKAHVALQPNSATAPGVWGTPTVDASLGTVFVATGNAFTSTNQQTCTSTPLACALVALDWNTLAVKSSWQVPASQSLGDGDFGSTPTLFPGLAGATWLGVGNKNGWYYVFDTANVTAGPKWEVKMASGGSNSINGIIGPTAYYPGTVGSCTGVLFLAAGTTTLNGTAYGGSVSALCALTGQVLWQQGTTGHCIAAATIANGLVADEQGGTIELRDWSTGAVLFHYTTGGATHGAAAFANGRVYAGSANSTIYAFGP